MPYCSNCGSQIVAGSKFCSNCGAAQQVTSPPSPRPTTTPVPQQPQLQGEPIQAYIQQCKYGFPVSTFTLFITNRRIIAAKTGGLGANFAAAGAASGGLVGGLIGAGIDARATGGMNKKTLEYSQMTPDQMISKDKKNFEIQLPSIQSVEMKQPGFIGQGEIKFITPGKDHKFMLDVSKEIFAQYIPMLQGILPGRVYVK